MSETGFLDVLNVGHGHLTFRFDRNDADEVTKAKKVIQDMLKRGYMIFVKIDGDQKRVRAFDEAHEEYILEELDELTDEAPAASAEINQNNEPKKRGRPRGSTGRRVPMRRAQATGIGPTAGG